MSELTTHIERQQKNEVDPMGDVVDAGNRFRRHNAELPGTGTEGPAPAPAPAPVVLDKQPSIPAQWTPDLDEDPEGDAPWTPAWVRSWEGVNARRRYAQRQMRRRARRWTARQRTVHGVLPRAGRGIKRTRQWVQGTEGIALQAAKETAHRRSLEARSAARAARYAVLDRKAKGRAAEKTADELKHALKDLEAVKKGARKARLLRGAAAYGPVAAALGSGAYMGGLWGMAAGGVLTLCAATIPGRRPWTDDETVFEERAEERILDPGMTPAAFGRMLRDALEEDLGVKVADLHVSGQPWGFEARVQLFKSKPADVMARLDDLEASLVARPNSLLVQQSAKARPMFTLRALGSDPWAGMATLPYRAPLSQRIASDIPMGRCLTQAPLTLPLLRTNGVMVGGPGSGKSTALLDVAEGLTACEDAVVWDIDLGSSGAGLDPMGEAISRRATSKAAAEILLKDALSIAKARPRLFKQLGMGRNWQPSEKYPALVLLIDEYPALVAAGLFPLVSEIIRTGRKSAVTVIMAAQGASKDFLGAADPASVPLRIALPCQGQDVTRLMGSGSIAEGWSAHRLSPAEGNEPRDASVCYIRSGRHTEPIPHRFAWLDEDEAERRAIERKAAGLPVLDAESLSIAGVDVAAELPDTVETWTPAEDGLTEDGEYAQEQAEVALPDLPATVIAVLEEHEGPAMTSADILAALQAKDPAAYGEMSVVDLGRKLSKFGATARSFGRGRAVYYADMVAAAAAYRAGKTA
jgi:hypothetical protein